MTQTQEIVDRLRQERDASRARAERAEAERDAAKASLGELERRVAMLREELLRIAELTGRGVPAGKGREGT